MPGWIIQGVRGEGKSLCAVGKIREYLQRGCPVATNLDLYLDKLLPPDNESIVYRLPDHPRLADFELLPPAYDVNYKAEDKNGLIVLDELGTWLNSRSWNDKTRLGILGWLFLSRKHHWDIVLLAQDFEMIDNQVRTTLCDYLVQASRLDRQKIPFISALLAFLGFGKSLVPNVHIYHVFYGLSTANPPVDRWSFSGKDLYDGYNTNQRFLDGFEIINNERVDMRATYTYLPASYLSGIYYFKKNLRALIPAVVSFDSAHLVFNSLKLSSGDHMSARHSSLVTNPDFIKLVFGLIFLIGFVLYNFVFTDKDSSVVSNVMPTPSVPAPAQSAPVQSQPPVQPQPSQPQASPQSQILPNSKFDKEFNRNGYKEQSFLAMLLERFTPYLLSSVDYGDNGGVKYGTINFLDSNNRIVDIVEVSELHDLNAILLKRSYGADLIYDHHRYIVRTTAYAFNTAINKQYLQSLPDNRSELSSEAEEQIKSQSVANSTNSKI